MTTYFRKQETCANCRHPSTQDMLGSTNTMGAPDLDLRPAEMQRSTMSAWLQECPNCHYVAPELSGATGDLTRVKSAEYRAGLDDNRYPALARRFIAHSILLGSTSPTDAGFARLRAAWVCDDANLVDLAAECRGVAADGMATQRPFPDTIQGVTAGAVLVDVLRRGGRLEEAAAECDSLLDFESTADVVRKVLEYQARLIANRDQTAHTIASALG